MKFLTLIAILFLIGCTHLEGAGHQYDLYDNWALSESYDEMTERRRIAASTYWRRGINRSYRLSFVCDNGLPTMTWHRMNHEFWDADGGFILIFKKPGESPKQVYMRTHYLGNDEATHIFDAEDVAYFSGTGQIKTRYAGEDYIINQGGFAEAIQRVQKRCGLLTAGVSE